MGKIKVLCFHPALAPYRVDFFNLLAQQIDLEVVFLMENLRSQQLDQQGLRAAVRFKYRILTRGFEIKGRLWRWGIARLVREVCPDVVIGYEASPVTLFLCLLQQFAGYRLWTSMDEAAVTILARRGVRAWMRDFVLNRCDGVMVPSEESAKALKKVRTDLMTAVVPIIHDTAAIRKDATEVIAAGRNWRKSLPLRWQKVLLFVGRLASVKNLTWLIDQMSNLPHDIGLVIVGEGPDGAGLQRQVSELHLEGRVRFDGKHEGEAVYARMSAADVLVLPSRYDAYGAVVGEALQWGTPCVVSDCVGAKGLINEDNGAIYISGDRESFKTSLSSALVLKRDCESKLAIGLEDAVRELGIRLSGKADAL